MLPQLTPGRWHGLKTTSTDQQIFTILAFDQRGSYQKMLPSNATYADAVAIKTAVVGYLTKVASAVLLDPHYGFEPAMHRARQSGLLVALEETGYSGASTYRKTQFLDGWNIEKIKRMGASAVKLMVYYHPQSGGLAAENDAMIAQVCAECHAYDLPVFVEPMSYSLDANISKTSAEFAHTRPAVVRDTAARLSQLGADVLKLEFPCDAAFETDIGHWREACQAISEVCTIPWVLLSAGVDFAVFEQQLRVACQAGASGFLAGRAIWKECVAMSSADRVAFLRGTATQRAQTLVDIANEQARPITDFYEPMDGSEGWYQSY